MSPFQLPVLATALIVSTAAAQIVTPDGEAYRVPGSDALVRIWSQGATPRSALSKDAGRSWRELLPIDHRLMLRYREFDPLAGEPVVPPALRARAGNRLWIVQFKTQILDEYRAGLTHLGAQVHQHLPFQSYVVRVAATRLAAIRALPYVRWVGAYHPAYRLEPEIGVALLGERPPANARYNIVLIDKRRDAASLEADVRLAGGTVEIEAGGGIVVEATLSAKQLVDIAARDTVLWIDRHTAPEEDMDNARIQTGANHVESLAGIDGKGLTGHVHEGVYRTHTEFAARSPYRQMPIAVLNTRTSGHGNSTAGQIYGRGARSQAKGMVPFAQLTFTHYSGLRTSRYSLTQTLVSQYKVMFQTASWGGGRTRSYTSTSANMDDIIHDFDLFITQSQSNAGNQDSRPQAWAKNIASVGGFRHYNNSRASDDCWCRTGSTGPAADGRIGVSFAAYYDSIYTTGGSSTSYTTRFGGTSGATPIVNGCGAATIQMFTDGLFGHPKAPDWRQRYAFLPHFTTTKALMAATTRQLPFSRATRVQQGWGTPSLQDMFDLRDRMLVIDEQDVLRTGESRTYWLWVEPNTGSLRIAMQYADLPGTTSSRIHRINSLDLQVRTPSGQTYWGNNGLLNGLWSSPGGVSNDRDTEECVFLQNPAAGIYSVSVCATAVRQDAHKQTSATDADYALVAAGVGGMRDTKGLKLDLVSTRHGDFRVSLTNRPGGWSGGYTVLSESTKRPASTGTLLGVEADDMSLGILSFHQRAGNVFAFTASSNTSQYPYATFAFPAGVAAMLKGREFDAVALLHDSSSRIVAVSNVDRVKIQ